MKFPANYKILALGAISAILSACGGGGAGAVDSPVTSQVTAAPTIVTLGQSFLVSGVAVSQPNLMALTAWTVTKLTAGSPDLVVANADCAVAAKVNKTVNGTTSTPTSLSTWGCDAVIVAPLSLAVDSSYRVTFVGTDVLGNTGTSYRDVAISHGTVGPIAAAPVATTPATVAVVSGDNVDLTCFASGGTIAASSAYRIQWVIKSNPQALALATTSPTPQDVVFKAPAVSAPTNVVFECRVTDDNLLTSVSDTTVTISPAPTGTAIANAGGSQSTTPGSLVTLSAAGSTPTSGLYYTWIQTGGPTVTLAGANTANPTFVAPPATVSTPLTFQLVAQTTFGTVANAVPSEIDTATVYDSPQAALTLLMPSASIVKAGTAVVFTVSVVPSTTQVFYEWTKVSGPAVTMGGANTATTSFIAPAVAATTEMVFSVSISRSPIATAPPSEIYSSDVVIDVTP